ncbi:MAG: substrate-binding domain-containing protein [Verrucomicrobiota bacterium]
MNRLKLLLTSLLLTILAACGGSSQDSDDSSSSAATPSGDKPVIAASCITLTNPYFILIKDVMTEEAARHGYDVIFLSGDQDPAKQANQVKDFIVQGAAAIALNPCDSKAIGPAIAEANEAGIPVFTFDIKCQADGVDIVSHIATDNFQGGQLAGEAMIEALGPEGGEVAILDYRSVESCIMRVDGFKEVIDKHNAANPDAQIKIVAELPGEGVKDKGYKAAEDALQASPNLDGIFAINDPSGLGAVAALERAGKQDQVVVIAFDGQPDGKRAIRDGKIYADPVQFPDEIARKTVESIVAHFDGEEVEPEYLIKAALYRQSDAQNDPDLN